MNTQKLFLAILLIGSWMVTSARVIEQDGFKVDVPDNIPEHQFWVRHADPFVDIDLNTDNPPRLMLNIQDSKEQQVTWGTILDNGEGAVFPISEVMRFQEPFWMSISSAEYGQSPTVFGPIYRGDVVYIWYKGGVLTGQVTTESQVEYKPDTEQTVQSDDPKELGSYQYYCVGSKQCSQASKDNFNYTNVEIETLEKEQSAAKPKEATPVSIGELQVTVEELPAEKKEQAPLKVPASMLANNATELAFEAAEAKSLK